MVVRGAVCAAAAVASSALAAACLPRPSSTPVRCAAASASSLVPGPAQNPSYPFWLSDPVDAEVQVRRDPWPPSNTVDVVVVGGGMSGASAAMHLAQQGRSVCLMDARGVAGGASGRNGSFVYAYGIENFASLWREYGFISAVRLTLFEHANKRALRKFVHDQALDCDYRQDVDAVRLFTDAGTMQKDLGWLGFLGRLGGLKQWCVNRSDDTAQDATTGKGSSTGPEAVNTTASSPYVCGYLAPAHCDTVWAAKLVFGIASQARRLGANLQPNTRVLAVQRLQQAAEQTETQGAATAFRFRVQTDRGDVLCNHVVYCTNAYTGDLLPELASKIMPVWNGVISTAPTQHRLLRNEGDTPKDVGIIFDPGWVYCVQRADTRVVLGGFRQLQPEAGIGERDDSIQPPAMVTGEMRSFLKTHFAGFDEVEIEHEWSGIIGWSCDQLPWVGAMPQRDGEWVCAGFSGHGMTKTFLCGAAVADMVCGRQPHWPFPAARFRPDLSRTGTSWFNFD